MKLHIGISITLRCIYFSFCLMPHLLVTVTGTRQGWLKWHWWLLIKYLIKSEGLEGYLNKLSGHMDHLSL